MTLGTRDRRAIGILGACVVLTVLFELWPSSTEPAEAVAKSSAPSTVGAAEKALAELRERAATVPAKEEILKNVQAELATREKGLIAADTAPQAQAQLFQILRKLGRAENPPIDIRQVELGGLRALGDGYGQIDVAVQIECHIDQLINLLAALAAQPELISTTELRITSSNAKDKSVGVRLGVTGIVPRRLVPEKKGGTAL